MTAIFRVNENNDVFTIAGGRLAIARDLQAVLQQAEHALKALTNEMIYSYDRGVNVEQSIFDGSPNLLSFEASARMALTRIPDVLQVVDFSANLTGNTLQYRTTIRTVFGTDTVSGNGGL